MFVSPSLFTLLLNCAMMLLRSEPALLTLAPLLTPLGLAGDPLGCPLGRGGRAPLPVPLMLCIDLPREMEREILGVLLLLLSLLSPLVSSMLCMDLPREMERESLAGVLLLLSLKALSLLLLSMYMDRLRETERRSLLRGVLLLLLLLLSMSL